MVLQTLFSNMQTTKCDRNANNILYLAFYVKIENLKIFHWEIAHFKFL